MASPRDERALLSSERERAIFDRAAKEYATPRERMRLLAYLKDAAWDEDIAHEKMEDLQELMRTVPIPPFAQIRPFYYTDAEARPAPCCLLLEDGRGGCARAKDGSIIIASFGALAGSSEDMIRQIGFVFARCDQYFADDEMPRVTFVTDLLARKGTHTVQSPDLKVADFMTKFPLSFMAYTCGVEPWMERAAESAMSAMGAADRALAESLQAKYKISAGYDILEEAIDADQRLPWWNGGTFNFSIEALNGYLARVA
jgi:hypothetical protein